MFDRKYKVLNSRRHKRLYANYLVKFQIVDTNEGPFVSNLKDISAGGLRFWTDRYMQEGTLLSINVLVPPIGRVVKGLARVVRVRFSEARIYYVGVSFIEIHHEDREALDRFVESLSQKPGAASIVHHPQVVTRQAPFQPV